MLGRLTGSIRLTAGKMTRSALLVLCALAAACGSQKGDAQSGDDGQDSEMNEYSSGSGSREGRDDDVEPADHDVEVPPAP
jgi:hypothetical protein